MVEDRCFGRRVESFERYISGCVYSLIVKLQRNVTDRCRLIRYCSKKSNLSISVKFEPLRQKANEAPWCCTFRLRQLLYVYFLT